MSRVEDKDSRTLTITKNEVVCQECGTKNKKQNLTDFLISLKQRSCDSCGSKLSPRYDEMFKDIIYYINEYATALLA
jgi:NAD-dependent SIR2 family protein deacetylase